MTCGFGGGDGRTQRERMLAGEPYVAEDIELARDSLGARRLQEAFNRSAAEASAERRRMLSELLGAFGSDSEIRRPF